MNSFPGSAEETRVHNLETFLKIKKEECEIFFACKSKPREEPNITLRSRTPDFTDEQKEAIT